jgi:hypothetical protein
MMRDTPRCLVGSVTFRWTTPPGDPEARIRRELAALDGVRLVGLDAVTVTVTAERPTDRAELVRALELAGCGVAG